MKGETRERWQLLCALAADERDPQKLLEFVQEINRLLQEKEQRLAGRQLTADAADEIVLPPGS